jgi:hypothetical protein
VVGCCEHDREASHTTNSLLLLEHLSKLRRLLGPGMGPVQVIAAKGSKAL